MPNQRGTARSRPGNDSSVSEQLQRSSGQDRTRAHTDGTGDALAAEALFRLSSSPAVSAPLLAQGSTTKQTFTNATLRNSPFADLFSRNGTSTPMFSGLLGGNLNSVSWTPQALNDQSASGFDPLAGTSPRWQTYSGLLQQQFFSAGAREPESRRPTGAPAGGGLHGFPLNHSSSLSPFDRELAGSTGFSGNVNFAPEGTPMAGANYAHSATAAILDALVGESASTPIRVEEDTSRRFRDFSEGRTHDLNEGAKRTRRHEPGQETLRVPQHTAGTKWMTVDRQTQIENSTPPNVQPASVSDTKRQNFRAGEQDRAENIANTWEARENRTHCPAPLDDFIQAIEVRKGYAPDALQRLFAELCDRYRKQQLLWPSPWDQIRPIAEERLEPDGTVTKLLYVPVLVPVFQNQSNWDTTQLTNADGVDTAQSLARDSAPSGSVSVAPCLSSRVEASLESWRSEGAFAADSSDKVSEEDAVTYIPSPTVYAHSRIPRLTPGMPEATRKEIEKLLSQREFKQMTRQAAIVRYRQKKKERRFMKVVRYSCRKVLADKRPRIRGRFVRQDIVAPD
ncbi:hypothetical protein F1559_001603 [Cyanidiococcus yangmingshanensis]|uniref:CCT domain-containing protein n=1 Tax=Cyanidiococcus yangmingshanensis TaxID=2690220 RepID=A0A7J7IG18_9RHOD|nr:hypothetical protein F1559_001603 [Cyanidiococcus yangmingshanensis]